VTKFGYKPRVLQMRLLISAGLTAAALSLWFLAGWGLSGFDGILGALASVYFGTRVLGNLREIAFARPVVRISEHGIQDRRLGAATIPWTAIVEIKQVTGGVGSGALFLEVREPNLYIGPSKGLLWIVYALRRNADKTQTGFLPLTPPEVLDLGETSLLDAVDAYAPHEIPVSAAGSRS